MPPTCVSRDFAEDNWHALDDLVDDDEDDETTDIHDEEGPADLKEVVEKD